MLTILANSFMTATRIDALHTRDASEPEDSRKRWFHSRHWRMQSKRRMDQRNR
ncbi:hypothetical protein HW561_20395 [Rhodobacteraceae bacterium B1Z28]|uniref:Uncharacterized protein n=1 Tax=Ruegeria haliotis TaxID=2747601 RepID=A0ABX2PYL6_9RHOB|nr:hypothetical protein [Ruegeria haliotis]NVO58157.1 hypothetical protein [Ruegeria haliotis]